MIGSWYAAEEASANAVAKQASRMTGEQFRATGAGHPVKSAPIGKLCVKNGVNFHPDCASSRGKSVLTHLSGNRAPESDLPDRVFAVATP